MDMKILSFYSPVIVVSIAAAAVLWHFFIKRWISLILYHFGYLRYSSLDDEKRGLNEHIRLLRRNFKRKQRRNRKCYYRMLTNPDGTIVTETQNGRTLYTVQCLETGEIRAMDKAWIDEALYFKIISNADKIDGTVTIVNDVNTEPVPEFNKKVGDISYFNRIIGAYSDWSLIQMDVDAISSEFYK